MKNMGRWSNFNIITLSKIELSASAKWLVKQIVVTSLTDW